MKDWGSDPAATTVHLDRGSDSGVTRTQLDTQSVAGAIACKGPAAPVRAGKRWVVERSHAWTNGFGKLRRCTEKTRAMVELYQFLEEIIVVTRCPIQRACRRYRWPGRPTTRRLN